MPTYCQPDALEPSETTAPTVTPIVAAGTVTAPNTFGAVAAATMPLPCEPVVEPVVEPE